MSMIKTILLRSKRWRVKSQAGLRPPDVAECDIEKRWIKIPIDGDTQYELDWTIHEVLHACLPDLCEKAVDETATSVARLLWRLNWRKADS